MAFPFAHAMYATLNAHATEKKHPRNLLPTHFTLAQNKSANFFGNSRIVREIRRETVEDRFGVCLVGAPRLWLS
jgi:hypothetical protein